MKQISVHHLCDDGGNNKINGNSNTETGTRTIDANIIFIMSIKHLPSTQNHTIHSNYTPRKCEGDEVRVSDATKYSTLVAEQRETEKDLPEMECTIYMCIVLCVCVFLYASVFVSTDTNCNKISMYNEMVCLHCIGIGVLLVYNNGINIWFTFIHYIECLPPNEAEWKCFMTRKKSHPNRLRSMVGFKCQYMCVCIKYAHIQW